MLLSAGGAQKKVTAPPSVICPQSVACFGKRNGFQEEHMSVWWFENARYLLVFFVFVLFEMGKVASGETWKCKREPFIEDAV